MKRQGGHGNWSNQEVTSETIELWAAVLKYLLGFHDSQVDIDNKQPRKSWLTSGSLKECAYTHLYLVHRLCNM